MFKANLALLVNSKSAKTRELPQRPCPYAHSCPKSSIALWAALGMSFSLSERFFPALAAGSAECGDPSSAGIVSVLITLVLKQ